MLRFRRYRVLLVAAVFSIFAFYRFSLSNALYGYHSPTTASGQFQTPANVDNSGPVAAPNGAVDSKDGTSSVVEVDRDATSATPTVLSRRPPSATAYKSPTHDTRAAANTSFPLPTLAEQPKTRLDAEEEASISTTLRVLPTSPATADSAPYKEGALVQGGQARLEVPPPLTDKPAIHWSRMSEHFPVPTESIISLPTGKPEKLPQVQYTFGAETAGQKAEREKRLAEIKEAFQFTWRNYKENAWLHDELRPVTGGWKDPFCSWAATLVDSLDTLHLMGMHDEFASAVHAVAKIDFTTSPRKDIPVFETVIRYLGGLLGAYDVSGGKYPALLEKAGELGDVIMGAFDTPNRMPITFYYWAPTFAANPHRAGTRTVLAELGSLALEFTRLAQLTREPRFYDAVARITNELEAYQNNTLLPGLWPKFVDTSGCKKPPPPEALDTSSYQIRTGDDTTSAEKPLARPIDSAERRPGGRTETQKDALAPGDGDALARFSDGELSTPDFHKADQATSSDAEPVAKVKRQLPSDEELQGLSTTHNSGVHDYKPAPIIVNNPAPERVDCQPQGLSAPPSSNVQFYTLGSMADSTYEYLPKQYVLLGGRAPQYRSMYETAIDATNKHLLFRPLIKDDETRMAVLGLGTAEVHEASAPSETPSVELRPEFAHLSCFAGGMYGLGAKLFGRTADMDIAKQLTESCVWAYGATTIGVMPESFEVLACERWDNACAWNQTRWEDALDPYRAEREARQAIAEEEKQRELVEESRQAHLSKALQQKMETKTDTRVAAPEAVPTTLVTERLAATVDTLNQPTSAPLAKRQLESMARSDPAPDPQATKVNALADSVPGAGTASSEEPQPSGTSTAVFVATASAVANAETADVSTTTADQPTSTASASEEIESYNPYPSHEDFVQKRIKNEGLWEGVTSVSSRTYILRPEAIESVFYMYRITGDETWRAKGWRMWRAIQEHARAPYGYAALRDVTLASQRFSTYNDTERITQNQSDSMESFWLAETLKYFYLLFSSPSTIDLDDWVFNTEAHPFRRPK